jgi:hypothetical protein
MKQPKEGNWFKKHKVLTGLLGIVVLVIVVSATGGGGTDTNSNNNDGGTSVKTESKETVAKIGEPARDGKFEFTVKGVTCGKETVGTNEYLTKKAQGQYCLMDLTVKNIGNEKQSLLSSDQKLFNKDGQEYSADDIATMYNSEDSTSTWYSDINPGNSVSGVIVFDIPKDQTPVSAELHDSAFSNGVKVNL